MSVPASEAPGADEMCTQCGHPFNPHRLLGHGSPPTEGWMECPVEGCNCKMTWSLEPEVAAQVKTKGDGASRSGGSKLNRKQRPWFHYLLLWPIMLDADKEKRKGRFLTPREWVGWGVVALVIVLAVILT